MENKKTRMQNSFLLFSIPLSYFIGDISMHLTDTVIETLCNVDYIGGLPKGIGSDADRPSVAFRALDHGDGGSQTRMLCNLCMHLPTKTECNKFNWLRP